MLSEEMVKEESEGAKEGGAVAGCVAGFGEDSEAKAKAGREEGFGEEERPALNGKGTGDKAEGLEGDDPVAGAREATTSARERDARRRTLAAWRSSVGTSSWEVAQRRGISRLGELARTLAMPIDAVSDPKRWRGERRTYDEGGSGGVDGDDDWLTKRYLVTPSRQARLRRRLTSRPASPHGESATSDSLPGRAERELTFLKGVSSDGYYVAYKPITLSCILFMFIEIKFIHCHSCVMFAIKSISMCND